MSPFAAGLWWACVGMGAIAATGLIGVGARRSEGARFCPATWAPRLPDPVDAEPRCVVVLKDGTRLSGSLVERTDDRVVLRIDRVLTTVEMLRIDRVELLEPIIDRYEAMRAAVGDSDTDQILLLVDWLIGHAEYRLALDEVRQILQRDPLNPKALQYRVMLEQQIALLASRRDPSDDGAPNPIPHRRTFPTLAPEQVNLIRVYEVDLASPPRMVIEHETIDRLIERYAGHEEIPLSPEGRDALHHLAPHRVLELLFRLRARDLYPEVQVLEDPGSMHRFREDVHRGWLLRGCATSRCHGGDNAGNLPLAMDRPNSDETVYTNFLILDRYRLADGTPLINYEEPAKSPLLQMALPRENSRFPHPPVLELGRERPWRAVLTSPDDPRFERALQWIRSMYRPHTDYPVVYTPPQPLLDRAGDQNPLR